MSHEVESMAYVGQTPWHGIGHSLVDAPSVPIMVREAGLDWRVRKEPVHVRERDDQYVQVPGQFALVRDTDHKVLGMCKKDYVVTQNARSMEFFQQFVAAGAAKLETAGSLRGGRTIWALANLNHDFQVAQGDSLKSYVLLANHHEPGRSLIVRATSVRVVCANTLAMALGENNGEYRMRHTREFNEGTQREALDVLGLSVEKLQSFARMAQELKAAPMALDLVESWVLQLVGAQSMDDSSAAKAIMESYYHAPGADPGTAWGALNAVTHYADHRVRTRGNDRERRLERALFGDTSLLKARALETLMEVW